MPEANMPPMKMNEAGASTTPPEIARPLVQPPAMPAAYSSSAAARNTMIQRLATLGPKISVHCLSGILRHLNVPLSSADTRPPRNTPTRLKTAHVMPGGIIVLKYRLFGSSAKPIGATKFSYAPDAPTNCGAGSNALLNSSAITITTPSPEPATYGDHSGLLR